MGNSRRYSIMEHFQSINSYIPFSLDGVWNLSLAFCAVFAIILLRYFIISGAFYFVFYCRRHSRKQLNSKLPKTQQIKFEIKWSLVSSVIFAVFGLILGVMWQKGFSRIYLDFEEYGWFYLPFSFFLLSLFHEVYFYFSHRFMHFEKIYQWIHAIHHRSVHTSPWASFSFHPGEAVIEAAILPILVLIIPVHPLVLISYLTLMTVSAVINHLGYELFSSHLFHRFFISGSHHSLHHQRFKGNCGRYFRFIDNFVGTEIAVTKPKQGDKEGCSLATNS